MDISLAKTDMLLPSEAIPRGHEKYSWAHHPTTTMGVSPFGSTLPAWYTGIRHETWPFIIPWWTMFRASGSPEPRNTRVQLRNLKLYMKTKAGWKLISNTDAFRGEEVKEDRSETRPWTVKTETDGTMSFAPEIGWSSHGWDHVLPIDVNDVKGVYVEMEHRIILDNPYDADNRLRDVWVVSVGADYYGPDGKVTPGNPSVAIGRQQRACPDWRKALMVTM